MSWGGRRLSWGLIAGLVLAVVLPGSLYPALAVRSLPQPGQNLAVGRSILVFDRTGKQLGEYDPRGQYRVELRLREMGKLVPAAVLAAEDREFYQHGAISATGLARAVLVDSSGSGLQGGSTITQQLVKTELLSSDRTLTRKLREAYLAWAVERRYSKDQILEMYLNSIYLGHGAYGIGAAVKTYFGADKQVKDLDPAQAALLAGMVRAPASYDPVAHYADAHRRALYVLDGMVSRGAINRAQRDAAAAEDVGSQLHLDPQTARSIAPDVVAYAVSTIESRFGAQAIQQGGYSVYTTIDPGLQALAGQAVADGVAELAGKGVNNGDLLAANPRTGEILAWIGSADYHNAAIGGQFDVVLSPRQPGSSFKPYVYAAALRDRKIATCSTVHDSPTDFAGYRPLDFDNRFLGSMTAGQALLRSRNVPAVEVAAKEGIGNVIGLAHAMGIRSRLPAELPTAIGAGGVTMFEQVQGYQVFADQGHRMPLMAISKIVGPGGDTVFEQRAGAQEGQSDPLTPAEAYLVTAILKDYQRTWNLGWKVQMASKSGTTGGAQAGVHPDAWMMAYNPGLVVGAWAGNTGPNGAGKPVAAFGVEVGSSVLGRFLNGLGGAQPWYSQPPGLTARGGSLFLPGTENLCPAGPGGGRGQDRKQPAPEGDEGD